MNAALLMNEPLFRHEYPRRVRLAAVGCGDHAQRNVFPAFGYAPVDLVAACDLDRARAEAIGRQFGARAFYTDYQEMLERERPDAVSLVTSYDADGHPRYPALAVEAMRAGAHVWMEKPPAASSADVRMMQQVSRETNRFVAVGFKKMFVPANVKAKEIITRPEFGPVTSLTARYPQALPPAEARHDDRAMCSFLDHIVHPYSVLRLLGGPIESLCVESDRRTGTSVTLLRFTSGAVGTLHLPARPSDMAPKERTEIVGERANVVVDNNLRVTYYRPGGPVGAYGRAPTFYGPDSHAPLVWEPEFSLGQVYNKGLFLLGYAPELRYFCDCVLQNTPPVVGNLDDALEILRVYEAYRQADGQRVILRGPEKT